MAGELSTILDHIEKIGELRPRRRRRRRRTSSRSSNALRPDVPRPSLPREVALAAGARASPDGGFLVPSPQAGDERELLDLTAAQAAARDPPRATSTPPSCSRPTASAPPPTTSTPSRGSPTGRRRTRGAGAPARAASRSPSRTSSAPRACPSQAGSRILEGYRPPYTATVVERLARGRRAAARQDQPGRVRDGLVERELRLRPGPQPVGPRRASPAARAAAAPRPSPRASRRGRSAPTPAARSASPPRCAASSASSRPTARSRRYGMIAFASSLDQAGPLTRDVTDAALLLRAHGRPRPAATRPRSASRRRSRCRRAERLDGIRLGVPRGARPARAIEPGVLAAFDATLDAAREELGATRRERRAAARRRTRSAPTTCSRPAEASLEPRPLRRRPLRPARRRRRPARDVHARRATTASAPRSSAASCSAPTRCRAATTTPTTAARSACARRSPTTSRAAFERVDFVVTPTSADASPSSSARRPTTRWRCTSTTTSPCRCRWPASRRSRSRAGLSDGPAGRLPARRPGVQREPRSSTRPTRSSRRSASTARRASGGA